MKKTTSLLTLCAFAALPLSVSAAPMDTTTVITDAVTENEVATETKIINLEIKGMT